MYANVSAEGSSASTFTDPVTGRYSIELPADSAQTLEVKSQYPGYATLSKSIDVGSGGMVLDLQLTVDNCEAAPGYRRARIGVLTASFGGQIVDFLDRRGIRNDAIIAWDEDPSEYDVIVVNEAGDPGRETFQRFLHETDAAGTGVAFLDTRSSSGDDAGNGVGLLWQHLGNPSSRSSGLSSEIPHLYYRVAEAHPILDGFEVGDEIVFDESSTSKAHSWFDGYEGEGRTVIADAGRADTGDLGPGIGVQQRANNRHVLLSMHGADDFFESTGPLYWTPDAAKVFVNALEWASDTSLDCRPITGGLVVGNVTDANTGAGVSNATVTDTDTPDGSGIRSSNVEGDPAHGQGFHWRFTSQTGSKTFHASARRYVDATNSVDIRPDAANEADFALPAGKLDVSPGTLDTQLRIGQDAQERSFTVTNTGTAPAKVELTDRHGGFETLAMEPQPAEVRNVSGHFTTDAILSSDQLADTQAQGDPQPQAEPSAVPWTTLPDYPTRIQDNSAAVLDDVVYSFGGFNGETSTANAYTFDPALGQWQPIASLPEERAKPEVVEYNGLIYILGGWSDDGAADRSVFIYDPSNDTYRQAAPMPAGRAAPGAAVVDGKIYVVGGCSGIQTCTPSNNVWRYDPATDSWETLINYPELLSWLGCAGLEGRLFCAGGAGVGIFDNASASTYQFDPASSSWTKRADMPYDDWGMAYAAANGQFVISGGVTLGSRQVTNRSAAYDPATDVWTEIEPSNQTVYRAAGVCGFYKIGGVTFDTISGVEMHPGFNGCPATTDVPWLSVTPKSVTLQPGEQVSGTARMDATLDQPGTYTAGIGIRHDTPYRVDPVKVTVTATPPNNWGKIAGSVSSIDCQGTERPLAGAVVQINHAQGGVTRFAAADGGYGYWIAASNNPLELVVSSPSHTPQSRTARIIAGKTVVENFALQRTCGTGSAAQAP
ncbi:kelch repeat-containing protein [Actinopolymorpha sp. B17G11]|uniref:Kelch repeat-containing protein n=1 Tax=Actinopolymorpha sp. B17G11 TaxID=3160861 RepID=UPI0032E4C2AE